MRPGRRWAASPDIVLATRSRAWVVGRRAGEIPVVEGRYLVLNLRRFAKRPAGSLVGGGGGKMKSVVFAPLLTVALVCFLALGAAAADRPYPAAGPYTPVPPDVEVAQFTYALAVRSRCCRGGSRITAASIAGTSTAPTAAERTISSITALRWRSAVVTSVMATVAATAACAARRRCFRSIEGRATVKSPGGAAQLINVRPGAI